MLTALYRSSIDGRRFLAEAILSQDGTYEIPDDFTSRTVEILQVYLKSLGVRMETITEEDDYIGEPEHRTEMVDYQVGNAIIFCTIEEMYYLRKLRKVYRKYLKKHPHEVDDLDQLWDYIVEHLPFKKSEIPERVLKLFYDHLEAFSQL